MSHSRFLHYSRMTTFAPVKKRSHIVKMLQLQHLFSNMDLREAELEQDVRLVCGTEEDNSRPVCNASEESQGDMRVPVTDDRTDLGRSDGKTFEADSEEDDKTSLKDYSPTKPCDLDYEAESAKFRSAMRSVQANFAKLPHYIALATNIYDAQPVTQATFRRADFDDDDDEEPHFSLMLDAKDLRVLHGQGTFFEDELRHEYEEWVARMAGHDRGYAASTTRSTRDVQDSWEDGFDGEPEVRMREAVPVPTFAPDLSWRLGADASQQHKGNFDTDADADADVWRKRGAISKAAAYGPRASDMLQRAKGAFGLGSRLSNARQSALPSAPHMPLVSTFKPYSAMHAAGSQQQSSLGGQSSSSFNFDAESRAMNELRRARRRDGPAASIPTLTSPLGFMPRVRIPERKDEAEIVSHGVQVVEGLEPAWSERAGDAEARDFDDGVSERSGWRWEDVM